VSTGQALEKIASGGILAKMLWAPSLLIASLSVASPGRLASTYDDAACAAVEETDCRLPAPPPTAPPAVIDCNVQNESSFMAEMIGSCDMPRPAGVPALARANAPVAPLRWCDGINCTHDASPLRTASRADHRDQPLGSAHLALGHWDEFSRLTPTGELAPPSRSAPRIERPPRA